MSTVTPKKSFPNAPVGIQTSRSLIPPIKSHRGAVYILHPLSHSKQQWCPQDTAITSNIYVLALSSSLQFVVVLHESCILKQSKVLLMSFINANEFIKSKYLQDYVRRLEHELASHD